MLFVPQELVDRIIGELHDIPALKACALAGSSFRYPSQKVLLFALTLRPGAKNSRPSYTAAHSLLTKSPHIASYITRLRIRLPASGSRFEHTSADGIAFTAVLNGLANVRVCLLDAGHSSQAWENELDSELSSTILDFFTRQPLRELHTHYARRIPLPVFSCLLKAAPILFFEWVFVAEYDSAQLADAATPHLSTVKHLNTIYASDHVCEMLALPQLAFHTAALRELEIEVTYRYQDVVPGQTLISNAAQSLERLVLRFDDTWTAPVLPLPPLPALRRLELLFTLRDFSLQWLLDTVRTFLASTSDMLEIIVTFELVSLGPEPLPMAPNKDLFAAFDRVLKSLANSTLLVWRFPTTGEYDSPVREFSTWVRESMPTVDSRGSLVFERYIPSLQGEQLVIGPRWEMQSSSSSQRTRILL